MTKSRVFLFLLLAFIVGVALRSFVEIPVIIILFLAISSSVIVAAGILRQRKEAIVYGALIAMFAFGVFRFHQAVVSYPNLSQFYGKNLALQGILWEEPRMGQASERLKLRIEKINGVEVDQPFFVQVTKGRYPKHRLGDELLVRGMFEKPENFSDFDYISYLTRDNIFALMYFPSVEKVGEGQGNRLKRVLSSLKLSFESNIDRVLPEPHSAFLKGLTLGERESLPADLVENFSRTGTTHIIALSGYNITLLGRFFVGSLLLLTVPFRISFWIATVATILFVILTGASPSVVRAGVMGILVLVAQYEGRLYHIRNALAFAAFLMILQNPMILRFDAAFQLSFLATLGLIYLAPELDKKFSLFWLIIQQKLFSRHSPPADRQELDERFLYAYSRERKPLALKKIFVETLAAQLVVLPLLIYLFGRVSLVSPLVNLLVIVAVPYSMGMGFLTGISGFLWEPLSRIFALGNWVLLEYKIRLIEFFASLPLSSFILPAWFAIPMVLFYVLVIWRIWKRSKNI